MSELAVLDLLLRGMAIGAQLALALALSRGTRNRALSISAILFISANISFLMNGSGAMQRLFGPATELFWILQLGSAGLLWLFTVALFEDRSLDWRGFVPALSLTALGIVAHGAPGTVSRWLWSTHNLIGLVVALHAMFVILRSSRVDLVEARRRMRVPFVATVAGYSILLSTAQLGLLAGFGAAWYLLADAAIQTLLGLCGAAVMLEARDVLFGQARGEPDEQGDYDADAMWIDRLQSVVERDALWSREGLTISDLAAAIQLPEYRVRKLINDRLGHRNFPSFINEHRIAAAKVILCDHRQVRRTVASIAYDTGFGSLGPFNRAFRNATGDTPTDWRRRMLAETSPILEDSG